MTCQSNVWLSDMKSYGCAIMSPGGRSIPTRLSYHYMLNNRFIKSRQGKKNAKVKDTGRVKYIAMERRTPPAGAEAAACVYPSRWTVSQSCWGNIIYQSPTAAKKKKQGKWLQEHNDVLVERQPVKFVLDGITWKTRFQTRVKTNWALFNWTKQLCNTGFRTTVRLQWVD